MSMMSKKTKVILGAAAFALLLVLAALGYSLLAPRYSLRGEAVSQSSQTTKIAAPDFTVQNSGGDSVSFSDFKGRPVVLNFWASWCPPCKSEMPDYEEMYRQYSPKGIVFLMVDMTDGSRETVETAKRFLSSNHYTFPAYFDTKFSASDTYGISAIPDSIFIDCNGNVVNSYQGTIDSGTMKENIEKLLKQAKTSEAVS